MCAHIATHKGDGLAKKESQKLLLIIIVNKAIDCIKEILQWYSTKY